MAESDPENSANENSQSDWEATVTEESEAPCVPISFQPTPVEDNAQAMMRATFSNFCTGVPGAHIIGGIKSAKETDFTEDSLKISCLPPTGPFVLCRYNFRQSPVTPVRGFSAALRKFRFYQLKELSPVEFRHGEEDQDPFLIGVNCYAEVFLEVQDVALSGVNIDPKAVTVYPTTRVYGGVAVQKEFLTGKLSEAARHKLTHVRAASMPAEMEDRQLRCWCCMVQCLEPLLFTTSFGAILQLGEHPCSPQEKALRCHVSMPSKCCVLRCLLLDARNSLRVKLATLVSRSAWTPKQPLLAAFLKYALLQHAPPCHWAWHGRVALAALRGVRAIEFDRAGQNRWFLRLLQVCSTVTGLSSFVLFLRLCLDQRDSCK
eukprot:Skav225294  [mRNA]  locus=scaffold4099:405925:422979:- [translate_table: standard]